MKRAEFDQKKNDSVPLALASWLQPHPRRGFFLEGDGMERKVIISEDCSHPREAEMVIPTGHWPGSLDQL